MISLAKKCRMQKSGIIIFLSYELTASRNTCSKTLRQSFHGPHQSFRYILCYSKATWLNLSPIFGTALGLHRNARKQIDRYCFNKTMAIEKVEFVKKVKFPVSLRYETFQSGC